MSEARIASRYAKSLIDLSSQKQNLDKIKADMELVYRTISASKDLSNLLDSPVIKFDKKLNVLREVFKQLDPLSLSFIEIIVKKGREAYLQQVAEEFINQYNEQHKIGEATVVSASQLSDDARKQLSQLLKSLTPYETIHIKSEVDPQLIGGLVIRFGDRLIDASIRQNLQQIKKALV